jgi:hypothetical protein
MKIKFPEPDSPKIKIATIKEFVWKNKERILTGLGIAVIGIAFIAKGVNGKDLRMSEYFQAGIFEAKCRSDSEVDIAELTKILKKHPELKPCFGSYLEQAYVLEGDLVQAKRISVDSLKRLSFVNPFYLEYARNSLLIEEAKYDEALVKSTELGSKISQEVFPNLYSLNLVRTQFLQNLIQKSEASVEKWQEIKSLISNEIYTHLSDDQISLMDLYQK